MARQHTVTFGDAHFPAKHGQLLLDAALDSGIALPHDCRAGHCGTCCVRLVSGKVQGGAGAEPGIVHACQCRVVGDVSVEKDLRFPPQLVDGVLHSLRPASHEILEIGIRTERPLPYLAGQYAHLQFNGYPSRPFSITHPLRPQAGNPDARLLWFHVRRMRDGHVTAALGDRIKPGHKLRLSGPLGAAHFRPNKENPLILVGTSTGFAPLWSIAVAALRENPRRIMTVIAGGRYIESLYMWPALARLSAFPKVRLVPFCSTPQSVTDMIQFGRPTEFLPPLKPSDVVHACGAPSMVDAVKSVAAKSGAICYADAFSHAGGGKARQDPVGRSFWQLAGFTGKQVQEDAFKQQRRRSQSPARGFRMAAANVRSQYRSQEA